MMTADQVEALRLQLEAESTPKPETVRQIALACLGWPYVFGAWGEICTPGTRRKRARSDHPTIVSKCQVLSGKSSSCHGCQWGEGVRMFDCRGFTAWLLKQVGISISGQGATSQYNTAANWTQRGEIGDMPDAVCCVFRRSGKSMEHTGMHVGGGVVIDCSKGVSSVGLKGWTHYAIPAGLYNEGEIPMTNIRPTLRRGDRGTAVVEMQEILTMCGYKLGAVDGVFGTQTFNALVAFQTEAKLDPDGICGPKTWAALDIAEAQAPMAPATDSVEPFSPLASETYRVTIEGVTLAQYKQILQICPLAECYKE